MCNYNITNTKVWTQHYKRHYKGEAEVQQLKVKENISMLRASTEAVSICKRGQLIYGGEKLEIMFI